LPPGLPKESLLETAVVTEQNVSPTDLDNERPLNLSEEAPVEGSIGETGDDLEEHNLETPLNSGGDEVANAPLLEQNE
ncbi:hypothetical protein, partial [Proteus mirabilis]|uniref:hypothetical protein n=1 Tax=Proteus mirabilis TaxID=584 RepID=UPI001C131729